MNVIFCTNLPSPYRVDFFNEFGRYCKLTVLYERHKSAERNEAWTGVAAINFEEIYLDLVPVGVDRSRGPALRNYIWSHPSDILIFTNYVSPATIEAITWCRLHGREYYVEYDGGFNKKDSIVKGLLKKFLLKGARGHLTTADEHIKYLLSLGIDKRKIHKYPFTSVSEKDIAEANVLTSRGRGYFKQKLGVIEEKMILTVGRFSYGNGYGKGYDILMKLAGYMDSSTGIYIVGDEPTQEFIDWKMEKNLEHVHFVGFKNKNDLSEYYAAADVFTILSRGDVWGLVVNEAMTYGLPVISSKQCIAGTELVEDGQNGYLVDVENFEVIKSRFFKLLSDDSMRETFGRNSFLKIAEYTFHNMAHTHWNALGRGNRHYVKNFAKTLLGLTEEKIVIAVGQFIPRKGFDVLMQAATNLSDDIGIYIIGGEPTEEYLNMKESLKLTQVHFVGFQTKKELSYWYQAADCTAFPTREDIWGLVTNESLAFGVPVVATDKCVSAFEMIENGENGYIVHADDVIELADKIKLALNEDMYTASLVTAMKFTIEEMADFHVAFMREALNCTHDRALTK